MYLVASSLPGSLFIMPKPSGEWLMEDLGHCRSVGIDTIVSMLEPDEATEHSLQDEQAICSRNQIDFIQLAVQDRSLPSIEKFGKLVRRIVYKLQKGNSIAVHCRSGIGRSGTVVCGVLMSLGYSAHEAIEQTSNARKTPVPDTAEQREFLEKFEIILGEAKSVQ